jgi:phosphoadenosine phosphosulfate reductase
VSDSTTVPIPAELEQLHPVEVLQWAYATYGTNHVVATVSFEDAVLAHVVHLADPTAEIVLLDTQYLFAETLWFVDELRQRFDINVRVVTPAAGIVPDNRWQHDTEGCCAVRKVEPLQRTLDGKAAWVTGIRRVDGPTRADAPVASFDPVRNLVKINPLVSWTDADLAAWIAEHDLPANPLTERGYPSIGCWPCTRPVAPGEDRRAGRWADSDKTECGLHQ